MLDESLYNKAEKRVDQKIKFYRHLFSYVGVNFILLIVNYIYTPYEWWVLGVAFFWGIGLLFHFLRVFVIYDKFDELYRDNMIVKEMEKMRN
ncbi:MAG: hypothetical protein BZ138_03020 [Methanosphaera sp. rholeuAM270]|nr:MAG: hypothetical protein BZ138_03020 [Methanosphaera sp. rholeuAM270]